METANNPGCLLRIEDRLNDRWSGQPVKKDQQEEDVNPIEAIYCRACGREVTSRDHRISVQGGHNHAFFNPAGIVFELGCFSHAPGCQRAGAATSDFTWFAGYVWRYALCRQCRHHLGWFFATSGHSFFGLILANLVE